MAYEPSIGLITIHNKIIIPKDARKQVLQSLHIQHTSVVKTWKNARQMYFWPEMKNEITQLIGNCQECIALLPSRPKEPCIQTTAERPFEAMSADIGMLDGTFYLIAVDRYSGWPLVRPLQKLDTNAITRIFEEWFFEYGHPLRLRTDNGPQFWTEFNEWCKSMGIIHEKSSPEHHESNGHAECAVKEMKKLLEKPEVGKNSNQPWWSGETHHVFLTVLVRHNGHLGGDKVLLVLHYPVHMIGTTYHLLRPACNLLWTH